MRKGVPVVLRAEWQENSDAPCDTGTPIPVMQKEWPQYDWAAVDAVFPAKTGLYAYTRKALTQRGVAARRWLRARPERVIAVVTHSGFLRVGVSYRKYENADFRIFDFADGEGEDDAADVGGRLVEWEFTEKKGGGLGKSPKGTAGWEDTDPPLVRHDLEEAVGEMPN